MEGEGCSDIRAAIKDGLSKRTSEAGSRGCCPNPFSLAQKCLNVCLRGFPLGNSLVRHEYPVGILDVIEKFAPKHKRLKQAAVIKIIILSDKKEMLIRPGACLMKDEDFRMERTQE
ncbi:MAG: hypothetical protein J7L53_07960 [Deltaproteobacteria bacterium]|nr:hypothetical protein [Deltaproteobacteria bacterium]